jgi:hypothetical protein
MSLAHAPPHALTPPKCEDRFTTPTIEETPARDLRPHALQTVANKLGVFRRYTHTPSWHPKNEERLDLISDSPLTDTPPPIPSEAIHKISCTRPEIYQPFPNISIAMYMAAYFSGMDTKSKAHATSLAKMMKHPRFESEEMKDCDAHVENECLDKYLKYGTHPFQTQNGWQVATSIFQLRSDHLGLKTKPQCYLSTTYTIAKSPTLSDRCARPLPQCHSTLHHLRCIGLPTLTSHTSMSRCTLTHTCQTQ